MAEAKIGGVLLLALAAACALTAQAFAAEGAGDFVLPSSKAATVENCVEPTEYMRRNHFEVIRHQRDTTVYGGIRSTKHSLAGCVSCHVGYDGAERPVRINAEGQFCSACHEYAAVDMNCFDCHATVPKGELWNHETEAPAHAVGHPDRATPAGARDAHDARLARRTGDHQQ
jgi:hypothetical protein